MEESGSALIEGTLFDTSDGAGDQREPPPLVRGGTLSRYLLVERVGLGGMGVVWAAYDPELDRKVAIKLLRPRKRSEQARIRLIREAQAMARLNHANVMAVHDVGEHGGQVFVAMEFVQGKTLGRWVRATRREWREIVSMFVQAGRGLAEAHRAGLVHRDFKPANVLVGLEGRPRVTDFGLARSVETSAGGEDEAGSGSHWSASRIQQIESNPVTSLATQLTRTGSMLGTPAYMAPEQFEFGQFDARSDQFSFCVALWEALHRQRPFTGETIAELSDAVCKGKLAASPSDSRIPGFIDRALRRGLAVDPGARWPSMDALLTELSRNPVAGRRRWLIAAGLVASFAAALVVTPLLSRDSPIASVGACPDPSAELEGVWDSARREQLGVTVLGAEGRVDREKQWLSITAALDEYGQQWLMMRNDACEDGRRRKQKPSSTALLDARMRCLDTGRRQLAVTVELLMGGEVSVLDRAGALLSALPSLEACARLRDPHAHDDALDPHDPERIDELEPLRQRLAAAKVRLEFGAANQALSELRALEREARGLEFAPMRAEILTELGLATSAAEGGTPEQARELLEQAVIEAIRTQQDVQAARAASALIELLGCRLGQPELGLRWAARAEAWDERVDASAITRARRLVSEGVVRQRLGDPQGAARAYDAALDLLDLPKRPDPDDPDDPDVRRPSLEPDEALIASRALVGRAQVERASGDLHQARGSLRSSHALRLELLGDGHLDTVRVIAELAALEFELGDWSAAAAGFAAALPVLRSRRAESPDEAARIIIEHARLALARAELRGEGLLDIDHLDHSDLGLPPIEALLLSARLDRLRGQLDEAERRLEQADSLLEVGLEVGLDAGAPEAVRITLALERGELLLARHQFDRALVSFEGVMSQVGARRSPLAAEAFAGQGRALLELDRSDEARIMLEQAVAIWDELAPKGHPRAVVSLGLLANLAGPESRYRSRAEAIRAANP